MAHHLEVGEGVAARLGEAPVGMVLALVEWQDACAHHERPSVVLGGLLDVLHQRPAYALAAVGDVHADLEGHLVEVVLEERPEHGGADHAVAVVRREELLSLTAVG